MRGTRTSLFDSREETGIIPAYAGNTIAVLSIGVVLRDHPRICGEHVFMNLSVLSDMGSSPHMRGTHNLDRRHGRFHGIIPAYAGNTQRPIVRRT